MTGVIEPFPYDHDHHHDYGDCDSHSINVFRYILKLVPSLHSGGLIRVEVLSGFDFALKKDLQVDRFAVGNLEGGECKGGRLRVEDRSNKSG